MMSEVKTTKVLFERTKMEKEEGRGQDVVDVVLETHVVAASTIVAGMQIVTFVTGRTRVTLEQEAEEEHDGEAEQEAEEDEHDVFSGEGVINLLREDSRESHELRQGHIFRLPAGTIVYIINKHNQQKLCLVGLLQPVSTPGEFETFFDAGGENPETYIRSFSDEVKEAAFNAPKERVDRVYGKYSKGVILEVSREQIEQLSRKSSSKGGPVWPFGGGESQQGPFVLLGKHPSHKNQRGELYEANESDYKQLKDLDIQISYANITGGSMITPYYLSRSIAVSVTISGKGYKETVCPHLASQKSKRWEKEQQRENREKRRRVTSRSKSRNRANREESKSRNRASR